MGERPHAHMVYIPAELFLALKGKCWNLKIGESAAILDCINESLYREGLIDEETYQKFKERYRKPLLEVIRDREDASLKVEFNSAKFEVHKSTVEVKKTFTDYSKFSDEQLLSKYARAKLGNDVVALNMIQAEANRRGYKFLFDEGTGKVNKINLRGSVNE